jgi:hypothetical protein
VARLALTNLRGDFENVLPPSSSQERAEEREAGGLEATSPPVPEQYARTAPRSTTATRSTLTRRLDIIETSLDDVSGKLLDLLKFSQHIGFVRATTNWNDVVREVLIWLAAERQRRGVEIHVTYGDLPPLFIEPNELFGVLVTVLRLTMETLESPATSPATSTRGGTRGGHGGLIHVHTFSCADGQHVRTEIHAPEGPLSEAVSGILEPAAGATEELSPLHFEWALARETVETQYEGSLTWEVRDGGICFGLELPLKEN